jgi:uncharacterized protein
MDCRFSSLGHPNILATHRSTIEITKESSLTPRGDCIIGISSNKACDGLPEALKQALRQGKKLTITLECNGEHDTITAYGDTKLTLTDPVSMVIRKSSFTCPRTLAVRADKAAADLSRKLIEELKKGGHLKAALSI